MSIQLGISRDLKLREVEQVTGLSMPTLYRRLKDGRLRGTKLDNGSWRVPIVEVERILAGRRADEV